jgi:hypothetical protein
MCFASVGWYTFVPWKRHHGQCFGWVCGRLPCSGTRRRSTPLELRVAIAGLLGARGGQASVVGNSHGGRRLLTSGKVLQPKSHGNCRNSANRLTATDLSYARAGISAYKTLYFQTIAMRVGSVRQLHRIYDAFTSVVSRRRNRSVSVNDT